MTGSRTDSKWHWAIGGSVLLVLGVMAAIVALSVMRQGDNSSTITLLIGLTSTSVLAMLALLKTLDNAAELHQNTADTQATAKSIGELANGGMDAKIRLAVAEVLSPDVLDPTIKRQLAADEATRDRLDTTVAQLRARLNE
jgi:hypothetical protein